MTVRSVDLKINALVSDALLLVDESSLSSLDDRLFESLNVVLDPDGITSAVDDYPGEAWRDVWRREGGPIWAACREGSLVVNLLDRGDYYIRAFDSSLREAGLDVHGPVAVGHLTTTGASIALVSALDWMRRRSLTANLRSYRSLAMAPGDWMVEIGHTTPPSGGGEEGHFWAADRPAIVVGLSRGSAERRATNVFRTRGTDLRQ